MEEFLRKIDNFLRRDIWHIDTSSFNRTRSVVIKVAKVLTYSAREIHNNELTLRAMSLVYTTLLSLVPLLALSFSVLKAFGVVDNQLEPLLVRFLTPLGEKGVEISQKIMEFVSNMKVGVLGVIGLLVLMWTVFSLIKKIDDTLNIIWNVKEGRNLVRRFTNYLSLTLLGPVFLFVVLAMTASLASNTIVQKLISIEPFGTLIVIWGHILPYIIVSVLFTLIYMIVPNTSVNFRSAMLGGVIGGISWQAVGTIFTYSVASSTKYFAIYSSLAVLILFMMWLYISWLILLIGAQISYCHQNLDISGLKVDMTRLGSSIREKTVLLVMYTIGRSHFLGRKNLTLLDIVEETGMPYDLVSRSVNELRTNGLLTQTSDDPPRYLPARDIGSIKLTEIVNASRTNQQTDMLLKKSGKSEVVNKLSEQIDNSIRKELGGRSLRTLVSESENCQKKSAP